MENSFKLDLYLDEEIKKTMRYIKLKKGNTYLKACKTKRDLEAIKKDFCDNKGGYGEMEKFVNLANIKMNPNFYEFIKQIAEYYAKMPLTETETSTKIPIVEKRKYISDNIIISFLNKLYNEELNTPGKVRFSNENIKIFRNSFLGKKFNDGCMVYHNYYNGYSVLLLRRYFSIKDFIISACKCVELLPEIEFENYDNIVNIMTYYMKYKALEKIRTEFIQKDADALNIQFTDRLIMTARKIKSVTNNKCWDDIPKNDQAYILNFIDRVIAINLIIEKCTSLNEMLKLGNENGVLFNIEDFSIDTETILNNTKEKLLCYNRPIWN